ncbi:hypothetical protein V7O62_00865 [Methanolobus sp. ZRKC2]|uniref:hypothetical protein n=1 Tax=Methanolobus sp. ZRKC2 TaxID=3125783 RepID=UPI0032480E28
MRVKVNLSIFTSRLALTVFTIFILVQTTSAVSLGVSPHSLQFDMERGLIQKNITIINNGNDVMNYKVYAGSDYSEWVSISPSEFVLSPGITQDVTVCYTPTEDLIGNTTFKLNIVTKPTADKLGIGAGIRIPVTVLAGANEKISDASFITSFSRYFVNYL